MVAPIKSNLLFSKPVTLSEYGNNITCAENSGNMPLRPPCQFSADELRMEVMCALKDISDGKVTSQEMLEQEMLLW